MTFDDLAEALDATGYPWRTGGWPRGAAPGMPHMVLTRSGAQWAHGDNRAGLRVTEWRVELYTALQGFEEEAVLVAALDAHGLPFTQDEGGRVAEGVDAFVTYFNTSTIG